MRRRAPALAGRLLVAVSESCIAVYAAMKWRSASFTPPSAPSRSESVSLTASAARFRNRFGVEFDGPIDSGIDAPLESDARTDSGGGSSTWPRSTRARAVPASRRVDGGASGAVSSVPAMADDAYSKRREVWSAFARARGGTLRESDGVLTVGPVLEVPFGDALVRLDVPLMVEAVRVRAPFLLGRGPKFDVEPDPELVPFAHMSFDSAFLVRSPHLHGTRIAWTARAQELLLSFFPQARASSAGRVASVLVEPGSLSGNALEPACELAAELARYGERFMAPLRALDGAVWVPPEGPFEKRTYPSVRVVRSGVEIELHPERREKKLAVSARATLARAMEPFVITLSRDGTPREPPPGLFAPDTLDLVTTLAPATLSSDGATLWILLDGEADTERLTAVASFLATASGRAKTSPFR